MREESHYLPQINPLFALQPSYQATAAGSDPDHIRSDCLVALMVQFRGNDVVRVL